MKATHSWDTGACEAPFTHSIRNTDVGPHIQKNLHLIHCWVNGKVMRTYSINLPGGWSLIWMSLTTSLLLQCPLFSDRAWLFCLFLHQVTQPVSADGMHKWLLVVWKLNSSVAIFVPTQSIGEAFILLWPHLFLWTGSDNLFKLKCISSALCLSAQGQKSLWNELLCLKKNLMFQVGNTLWCSHCAQQD